MNSDYIFTVLSRHGKTPKIKRIVRDVMSGSYKSILDKKRGIVW